MSFGSAHLRKDITQTQDIGDVVPEGLGVFKRAAHALVNKKREKDHTR